MQVDDSVSNKSVSDESKQQQAIQETEDLIEPVSRMRAPRSIWLEGLLCLVTLTIYQCFWVIGRVRDLRSVNNKDYTLWLWFFTPLISLVHFFSWRELFKDLEQRELQTNSFWKSGTTLLLFVTLALGLIAYMIDFDQYFWAFIIYVLIVSIILMVFHMRFNQWKENIEDVEFYGKRNNFHWYEWVVLIIGIPFFLFSTYASLSPFLENKLHDLEDQQLVTNSQHGFELVIHGDGWRQVELGTHTEDEAIMEFSGRILNSFMIVFPLLKTESIEDVAKFRVADANDLFSNPKCEENRKLNASIMTVTSKVFCTGQMYYEDAFTASVVIENKQSDKYELYFYATGENKKHFKKFKNEVNKIADSFVVTANPPSNANSTANSKSTN